MHFRTIHIDCTASNDRLVLVPHSRRTFAANRSVQPRAPNPLAAVPDRDSLSCPSVVQSRMRQVNKRARIKIECFFIRSRTNLNIDIVVVRMNLEREESDLLACRKPQMRKSTQVFFFQLEFHFRKQKSCLFELIFGTLLCSSGDGSAVVQVALRPSRSARHSTA